MHIQITNDPFVKLKEGVNEISDAVKATLGPCGKNVLIDLKNKALSTRDGVTVASKIRFEDRIKDMGALLIREAAAQTNKEAGDGTTTAIILAQAIFNEALKEIMIAGRNLIDLKEELEASVKQVVEILKDKSKEIKTEEDIKDVATISANNDVFLGEIIAKAVYRVGEKGAVIVESGPETKLVFQEGLVIERGLSDTGPIFMTDVAKRIAEFENPHVLVINDKVHSIEQLLPILEYCKDKPLIIVALSVEDTVLGLLAKNKIEGRLRVAVIKTPGHNDYEVIEDFSEAVGARMFDPDFHTLDDFSPEDLGLCERAVIKLEDSAFIGGSGNIEKRINALKKQIQSEEDDFTKARVQDRVNRLQNSVAILKVGGESEVELTDKKLRIEDAIHSSKAAVSEGIVEGGGMALFRASFSSGLSPIIKKAIQEPFRVVVQNSGKIPEVIAMGLTDNEGYNARKGKTENLFDAGVIDPVKVTRTALQKAASVAIMLITTGPTITRINEE